jgi:hypothetical protein
MSDGKRKGIVLGPEEIEIVDRNDKSLGLRNFSLSLRMIIHEWDKNEAIKKAEQSFQNSQSERVEVA